MKFKILIILISFLTFSCKENLEKEVVTTYPDGSPKLVNFFKWKNDVKDVVKEIRYYPNGQKEIQGEYKEGKREGEWTYWYDNGEIWSKGSFVNGLSHGKSEVNYPDGTTNYKANYKDGNPDGDWEFYRNGKLIKKVMYKNGKKLKEEDIKN